MLKLSSFQALEVRWEKCSRVLWKFAAWFIFFLLSQLDDSRQVMERRQITPNSTLILAFSSEVCSEVLISAIDPTHTHCKPLIQALSLPASTTDSLGEGEKTFQRRHGRLSSSAKAPPPWWNRQAKFWGCTKRTRWELPTMVFFLFHQKLPAKLVLGPIWYGSAKALCRRFCVRLLFCSG